MHENSKLKAEENMLCTYIVSDIQNNFCTQHVLPYVLQKEELLIKIYLYSIDDWMLTDCTGLKSVNEFEKDINVVLGSDKVIAGNE